MTEQQQPEIKRAVKKLTPVQLSKLMITLNEQVSEPNENGVVRYLHNGWDDATVAELVGCKVHSVKYYRKQVKGELAEAPKTGLYERVKELKAMVDDILSINAELRAQNMDLHKRLQGLEQGYKNLRDDFERYKKLRGGGQSE